MPWRFAADVGCWVRCSRGSLLDPGGNMIVGNWIIRENLQVFLELRAQIAGTRLHDWDYFAIRDGLIGTNDERDTWFSYRIDGKKRSIIMQAADDPGSSVLHFQIEADDSSAELVELAFFMVQGTEIRAETPYD